MLALVLALVFAAPADGPFVEKWPNGKIKAQGEYTGGRRTGTWRTFYDTGAKRSVEGFRKGRHGRRVEWHSNGKVKFDWVYARGKLSAGTWKSWHDNGAFHTQWKVGKNGKAPAQTQIAYHDNGKVHYKGKWKNEKQAGRWNYWFKSGKKKEQRHFKNGVAHGTWTTWDANGRVASRVQYENGKRKK